MTARKLLGALAVAALIAGCGEQTQVSSSGTAASTVLSSSTPSAGAEEKLLRVPFQSFHAQGPCFAGAYA